MTDTEIAELIAQQASKLGGDVYFVGGCVRDKILKQENKDIDIEIHGITARHRHAVRSYVRTPCTPCRGSRIYNFPSLSRQCCPGWC